MADTRLMCKVCEEVTDHMHLGGRACICSVCGASNAAPNWREIEAEVEKRKAANQAAVIRRNHAGIEVPAETKQPKEGKMKRARSITAEDGEKMRLDFEALPESQHNHLGLQLMAGKYGCTKGAARQALKGLLKGKRGRKAAVPAAPLKGKEQVQRPAGGAFRVALGRMVEAEVERRLAALDLQSMVEAAMARALK